MKFSVTINLGDNDSITLETSKHKDGEKALQELVEILKKFPNDKVDRFFEKMCQQSDEGRTALLRKRWLDGKLGKDQSDIK